LKHTNEIFATCLSKTFAKKHMKALEKAIAKHNIQIKVATYV
jgi:hypothetical protein